MADEADVANDYIDNEVSRALGKIRPEMLDGKPGAKICKECGEKIPYARRKLGEFIKLCVSCAEEAERRKSLFAE